MTSFWTLFEQAGGSLNFLTDKYVQKHGIETSQFQSLNALFIILLAPVFTWIWNGLSKRNAEPRTPIKFTFALLQMALGYFIIVAGAKRPGHSQRRRFDPGNLPGVHVFIPHDRRIEFVAGGIIGSYQAFPRQNGGLCDGHLVPVDLLCA